MRLAVLALLALGTCAAEEPTKNFFGNQTESTDGRNRQGKDFLDFLGLGTSEDTDPYLAVTNSHCLAGDLAECFKSRALASLDEFFTKEGYFVNENVRIVRMPDVHLRKLSSESYEFSAPGRSDEPSWDQFVKFLLRKIEKFVKSTAVEVKVPDEITEEGRYSPRFVDEIASELDVIEDKKANIFTRYKLKKLFIPLLIVLKLFKLKLLLFLPMILGIASFKKLLGFLAIILPGLIGVFKLCKPQLYSTSFGSGHSNYYQPQYSTAGIANTNQYYSHSVPYRDDYEFGYNAKANSDGVAFSGRSEKSSGVSFKEDSENQKTDASDVVYSAYKPQGGTL